jgi:hypothetical protein
LAQWKGASTIITKADLDRVFLEQRRLTDIVAEEDGLGAESYLDNLGLSWQDSVQWASTYAFGNIASVRPSWDEDDIAFVASMLCRMLSMGVILGRETKP